MTRYRLNWITEDEADEEWLPGEWLPHSYYCNNKIDLYRRHNQAVTEGGYNFEVYVWNQKQYMLSNIGKEWD